MAAKTWDSNASEKGTKCSGTHKKTVAILALVAGVLILLSLTVWYVAGVLRYHERFFKGTIINGLDCSDRLPGEVCRELDSRLNGYELQVMGRDPREPAVTATIGIIDGDAVELRRKETDACVEEIFRKQNPYLWFSIYWKQPGEFTFDQEVEFDGEKLREIMEGWEACDDTVTVEPVDARISEFQPDAGNFRILPEIPGSRMDASKMLPKVEKALYALESWVDIEDTDCYLRARVGEDSPALKEQLEKRNSRLKARITYDWYGNDLTIGPELVQQWWNFEEEDPTLDEEAVAEFIREKASELDPNGNRFVFHTTLGEDLELQCKSGWKTDCKKETEEVLELIRSGAVVEERQPVSATRNYVWFDHGVGDSYAEIDLSNQHMYLYDQGEKVTESDFVSGNMAAGNGTPEGIFAVTGKARNVVLRGDDYESFVYFWMPFYGGYGIHDATWRNSFGKKIYLNNGSHGCINLPLEKADTVYSYLKVGFPVICYYYPEGRNPGEELPE